MGKHELEAAFFEAADKALDMAGLEGLGHAALFGEFGEKVFAAIWGADVVAEHNAAMEAFDLGVVA